jgi:hypothetical protein
MYVKVGAAQTNHGLFKIRVQNVKEFDLKEDL